jgi:hypothetical protein
MSQLAPATPQTEEEEVARTTAAIEAALADIDPKDTKALYARCNRILDDIHKGTFQEGKRGRTHEHDKGATGQPDHQRLPRRAGTLRAKRDSAAQSTAVPGSSPWQE